MRKNLGNNVLRTSALALACLAFVGADARASATQSYSTSDTIYGGGITGDNVLTFNPVSSGSFAGPSSIGLGAFVMSTLPDGVSTTYNNTAFSITFQPKDGNGMTVGSPATITGTLNGTITGNDSSTVVATFNPTSLLPTVAGGGLSTFSALDSPLHLVPASAGGLTTVQAQFIPTNPVPAPEPTTLAILATSLVGVGLRRKLRSGRKSS